MKDHKVPGHRPGTFVQYWIMEGTEMICNVRIPHRSLTDAVGHLVRLTAVQEHAWMAVSWDTEERYTTILAKLHVLDRPHGEVFGGYVMVATHVLVQALRATPDGVLTGRLVWRQGRVGRFIDIDSVRS